MALTHAPCTPPGPCGQFLAADATASPCASGSPLPTDSLIASALADPRARAAVAPRIAKRNLNMNSLLKSSCRDIPDPSVRSNNVEPGVANQNSSAGILT